MKLSHRGQLAIRILFILLAFSIEPGRYVIAQQAFWVFNHGIRDYPSSFSPVIDGLGLTSTGNYMAEQYSWSTQTLAQQSTDLAGDINTIGTVSSKKLILVGQSQGGLRVRNYLQKTGLSATYLTARNRVRGLAVIGTPNYGAPVASNGPGLVNYGLNSVAAVITFSSWLPGVYVALQPTIAGASQWLISTYTGPARDEMKPDSAFINTLNNGPYQSCTWQTYTHTHRFLWHTWTETHRYQVCNPSNYPGFNPIPSNVATTSIVGGNNYLDGWLTGNFGTVGDRRLWATATTVVASLLWGLAFWTFGATIPAAIAFTNLAGFLWTLPNLWKNTVGDSKNDILIPETSQNLYWKENSLQGIGGTFKAYTYLPTAYHSGKPGVNTELKDGQTVTALNELKNKVATIP